MGMAPGVAWRPIAYYVTVTYARAAPVTNSPQSTDCTNQIWQHPILSSKNWLRYISQSSLTQRIWRDWGFGGYTKLKTSNLPSGSACMYVKLTSQTSPLCSEGSPTQMIIWTLLHLLAHKWLQLLYVQLVYSIRLTPLVGWLSLKSLSPARRRNILRGINGLLKNLLVEAAW